MTAYLKWRGMLETTLSLYRAAGALAGIGATLCFSALHARLGALHAPHRIRIPPLTYTAGVVQHRWAYSAHMGFGNDASINDLQASCLSFPAITCTLAWSNPVLDRKCFQGFCVGP